MVQAQKSIDQGIGQQPAAMTLQEFNTLGAFIQSELGIKMPRGKKTMLESRLGRRLRNLGMTSFKEYQDYLFSQKGGDMEVPHLIDAVTTNKTEFFRERNHLETLFNELLPGWLKARESRKKFTVWSAGCSSGEEPYSLAMILAEFASDQAGFDFHILGTDISREVLIKAQRAVYPEKAAENIPFQLRTKYLMRSKDRSKELVRIVPELRAKTSFRELNLMQDFSFREEMEAIFCRNVIIYFERPVQVNLFQKLCRFLSPGGYLFIGHSETLSGMDVPLRQIRPTIYQKI